ncbi:MAG: sulfite exporter TauE/SafE family protein [Deltaproteobacteria bacterium]|nr:sulfite exporter TauE/SafE family protein [Deltaproteobacteria bacterium]
MENVSLPVLPLLGLIGGFLSGLLGLGGGVIMLPLLTFIGGVPLKLATGTDLVHVFIASATGMFFHYRNGIVDLKAGVLLGIAGIVGGFAGSFLSVQLSARNLQSIYLLVVALAITILLIPLKSENKDYKMGNFNKALGVTIGIGVGSLTGLLGIGGGFIILPLSIHLLEIPLRVTIGTSLLFILISSIGTIGAKFKVGQIHLPITLFVISGSVVGALLGAHISRKIQIKYLRVILISVLGLIFITVGFKTFFK